MINMEIKEITCKTALSSSRLPGLEYSLNPYSGCQHNCAYCYVPNVLRIKRELWGNFVNVKTNIPLILSKELKKRKPGVVGISTVTDPYQHVENKYKLTRFCLMQLLKFDFPISIQTKSSLVTRDLDLLSKFSDVEIIFSIATLNDDIRKKLEPTSSSIKDRFNALKRCSEENIQTSIFFGPIYPTISIDKIPFIIDNFIQHGISKIYIDSFNLKPGIWKNVKKRIQEDKNIYLPFLKNIFKDNNYYMKIRDEILKIGKEKKIKIVDAF